jgi:CubicO group peptidase (beta-lactamase class C family)
MKVGMRRITSALVCLALLCGAASARAAEDPKDKSFAKESDAGRAALKIVEEEGRRCGHPGWSVGIVTREGLLAGRGFGVRDRWSWKQVMPNTIFRIGSITKAFAGVALLQLRDEGKLGMDDTLSKYIPEMAKVIYPKKDSPAVTIRHMVTHTSGFQRDIPQGGVAREDDFMKMLGWTRLEFSPGKRTQYSNFAMGLAGPLIKRVTGSSFRETMQKKIFDPLGMTSTFWELKDVPRERRAWGYQKLTEERKTWEPMESEWRMGAAESFGGMYASLEDMARFVAFELSAWFGDEMPGVLKRSTLRESQTSAFTIDGVPQKHGIAWTVADDPAHGARVEHTGATDEYSATVAFHPKKNIGVVVLSNTHAPWDTDAIARRTLKRAADTLGSSNGT